MKKSYLIPLLLISLNSLALGWGMDLIWQRAGPYSGSRFGQSVTGLGDINGDRYGDFAVGSFDEKKLYVFYGGDPPDTIPDLIINNCPVWGIRGMCDLNGDGLYDLIAWSGNKVWIFFGGPILDTIPDLIIIPPGEFVAFKNTQLSMSGDFNADGYNDLALISSLRTGDTPGWVSVYFGGPDIDTVADIRFNPGDLPEMRRLYSIDLGGDFNGDGYNDLLIGKQGGGPGYTYFLFGGPSWDNIVDFTLIKEAHLWDYSGYFGDVNGDGISDAFISNVTAGGAEIYCGSPTPDTIPDYTLANNFCFRVGDLNRDHFDDIICGYWLTYWIYLWRGAIDVSLVSPDFGFENSGELAYVGDVNGDGCGDILVGYRYIEGAGYAKLYAGRPGGVPGISGDEVRPSEFEIINLYPNPCNLSFNVEFYNGNKSDVNLKLYNILGELVKEENRKGVIGKNKIRVDFPRESSSGLYFLVVRFKDDVVIKRVILTK